MSVLVRYGLIRPMLVHLKSKPLILKWNDNLCVGVPCTPSISLSSVNFWIWMQWVVLVATNPLNIGAKQHRYPSGFFLFGWTWGEGDRVGPQDSSSWTTLDPAGGIFLLKKMPYPFIYDPSLRSPPPPGWVPPTPLGGYRPDYFTGAQQKPGPRYYHWLSYFFTTFHQNVKITDIQKSPNE